MIHDVLLSCLNIYSKHLPIEEFVESDAASTFLHPCENSILRDIIEIINLLRDVAKFAQVYGNSNDIIPDAALKDADVTLENGLYLNAFANGLHVILGEYLAEVGELELRFLQNPTHSLLFIFHRLHAYEPLALFLRNLVRGISMQKLHGCAIVQYLYQNSQHGDKLICTAMKVLQSSVNVVFLKQLTHWMLYAKIEDSYGEFFIQCFEVKNNSTVGSDKGVNNGIGKRTTNAVSKATSTCADIWRYEIFHEFLPHYLPSSWAEKVLFIGQTVLIFKIDKNKIAKNSHFLHNVDKNSLNDEHSLWNKTEHMYFGKIQALQDEADVNVSHFEQVVNDIKSYVTTRLSEIAVNQADLVQQLRLIKDYFLLGRGEFFLEFVRQTYIITKSDWNENKLRDFVKAFESAAHNVGVSDELEKFRLGIAKHVTDVDDTGDFGHLQHLCLEYKINWPLHLLFSPKVMERYNMLFRFLLLIKRLQYTLHMMWCKHTSESKRNKPNDLKVMHLRNQLIFFVDNLQYYIQVDVIESHFTILLNTIQNKADFEQMQRAHSVFQANVLSLCFLLTDDDDKKESHLESLCPHPNNPVYGVLNDIFFLCEDVFVLLNQDKHPDSIRAAIDEYDERLIRFVDQLINLLVALKAAPTTTPLSQLLLRLDFNYWFSWKTKRQEDK